jgi:hypothetical protein
MRRLWLKGPRQVAPYQGCDSDNGDDIRGYHSNQRGKK